MTSTAVLPSSIRAHVSESAIDRVASFFNATLPDTFAELIQNARRSKPTRLSITAEPLQHGDTFIRFADDGCGIDDPAVLLSFGRSAWDRATADSEHPAGIGIYALSRAGCTVASRPRTAGPDPAHAWRAQITPECFLGKADAPVLPDDNAPFPHGTSVGFVTDRPLNEIRSALAEAARHCPIPILFAGETLERKAFLDGAVYAEKWNGIVFGVFRHHASGYRDPDINFHGLTIEARLPTVETIDDGVWAVRADIDNAPDLDLVLPARKELVETPFASEMRNAARIAIFRAMRAADRSPALSHEDYACARAAGIDMQPAPAVLRPWRPSLADCNDWRDPPRREPIRPSTQVMAIDPDPQDAQALWRAAERSGLVHRLFEADRRYEGYAWYDSLARITDVQFDINVDGVSHSLDAIRSPDATDPPPTGPGHPDTVARPDEIQLILHVARPASPADAIIVPADLAFAGAAWCYVSDTRPLVTRDSDIAPHELAGLIHASYFAPSDDCGADSWDTQNERFRQDAMHLAVKLLASEDEARKHTIEETVLREIFWVLPKDRDVSITVVNRKVSVEFNPTALSPAGVPA